MTKSGQHHQAWPSNRRLLSIFESHMDLYAVTMTMILDRHLDTHMCTEYDWKNLDQDRGTENLSPVACLNTGSNPTRPNPHNPLQTSCKWSACCVRNAGPHSSAKDIMDVHVLFKKMILRRLNNLVPRSNFRAPYLYHRFSYRKSDYTIGKLGASSLIYIFRYLQQD